MTPSQTQTGTSPFTKVVPSHRHSWGYAPILRPKRKWKPKRTWTPKAS